jgi:hypothetical protein
MIASAMKTYSGDPILNVVWQTTALGTIGIVAAKPSKMNGRHV